MSPVDAYIAELARALRGVPRRRRILAEASDHLAEAAAAFAATGASPADAGERAVRAFGPVESVARAHAQAPATSAARRAAASAGLAAPASVLLAALATGRGSPLAAGPWDGVALLAAQVAFAAWLVTALRLLRHRGEPAVGGGALRLLARGAGVMTGAAAVAAGAGAAALVSAPGGPGPAALLGAPGERAAAAAVLVTGAVALVAAAAVARARAPVAAAARLDPAPAPHWLDDLRVVLARVAVRLHARPALVPLLERGYRAGAAAAAAAGRLGADPRRRPWRFCAVVALGAGGALAAGHAAGEGVGNLAGAAAAAALLVAIEAAAVVLGFAALGRFLGLRR